MNIANEQIINFIWDMVFVLMADITICYLINRKNQRKEIIKTSILLLATLIMNIILGVTTKVNLSILLLGYEVICWIIIIDAIIANKKNISITLNKNEKLLMIISIFIGILAIIILFKSNVFYISPMKDNIYIGNYYFNADTHRSIVQISSAKDVTHKIHPLYRFIVLPIMLPLIIMNELLKGHVYFYYLEIISAYVICFMQIICNALSAIIMYKILKKEKLKEPISILGTITFALSLSMIWASILPETYAITTITLLMFMYLYQRKNLFCVACAILAIGSNIMAIVPIGLILLVEIIKNRKKLKKFFYIMLIVAIVVGIITIPYLSKYITEWMYTSKSASETFTDSINYFLIPLLYGPNFIRNGSLFVQINIFEPIVAGLLGIFMIFAIIGYITNCKKIIPNVCLIYLIVAYGLHVIFGYGFVNGILYSPLYCWPFVLLISYGINYIYEKINKKKIFIIMLVSLILSVLIYNFKWVIKMGDYLHQEEFNISTQKNGGIYKYLKNGDYFETLFYYNEALYRCSDGKEIVKHIDQLMVEEDYVVGLLKDSNWFKIYFEDNELKLNISNRIETIEKDNFYIFGMGLRKKFILTKENDTKYKLIEYDTKKDILTNLTIEKIDYKNYTIFFNNNIKIYENEYGIYIETEGQIETLDDSIYINIPNFAGYEHEEQLKILFNEVMVNITEDGPKPNFIAYDGVWYRDACIVAKVLQETNNLEQIYTWINSIDKIYDEQNGVKEADNLGQVLYLISLTKNKNQLIIEKVLQEAENLRTEDGYIDGFTDGNKHPVYQTKWLIYGMEELGIDSFYYKVPDIIDSYAELLWFYKEENTHKIKNNDRWQYLEFANLHYNKSKINYRNTMYPISNEILPSKANFENMNLLNKNFSKAHIVTPHAWSASEMFLYLLDLDRGNV